MTAANGDPPIIDLEPLLSAPSSAAATLVVEDIDTACTETGFFVVVGHAIDREMATAFEAARAFFAMPQHDKEAVPRVDGYGFVPHETLALSERPLGKGTEFFDMGLADEVPLPALAGFHQAVRSYQGAVLELSAVLFGALSRCLEIEPEFFETRMKNPQCKLRLMHYPRVKPDLNGALPVATTPHTDYGALTLLATDGVPGLEVKPIGSDWVPVTTPAGSLVVNLGDMLARWTNGIYQSTPHRVIGPSHCERFSIPFFVNPDPNVVIDCIPTCVTEQRGCQHEPVRAGDFLSSRIDSSAEPYVDPHEGPVRMLGSRVENVTGGQCESH